MSPSTSDQADHPQDTSFCSGERRDFVLLASVFHCSLCVSRHGQYNLKGATDAERILTEQGREQAKFAGQRLSELNLPITEFVISTMARAQETGKIILSQLSDKETFKIRNDSLLEEGAPIPPIPEVGHWRPENAVRTRHS